MVMAIKVPMSAVWTKTLNAKPRFPLRKNGLLKSRSTSDKACSSGNS